jgi:excisionase family DNA binding protein
MESEENMLLCAKDVANRLGIEPRTAARLMAGGEIEAFKLSGKVWRTTAAAVEAYVSRELAARRRKLRVA